MHASKIVSFLDQSCEPLPVECETEQFLICNVTCVVNALDKSRTIYDGPLPYHIEQYAFHPHRFEYSVFKILETAMTEVLCVEGLVDPNDEFKGTVERERLTGLRFMEIWSGK